MKINVPYIDPRVEHVGVSRLRSLNATNLRSFDKTLVIQENDKPLAVLLNYETFLELQSECERLFNTLELLNSPEEQASVTEGLKSALASPIGISLDDLECE